MHLPPSSPSSTFLFSCKVLEMILIQASSSLRSRLKKERVHERETPSRAPPSLFSLFYFSVFVQSFGNDTFVMMTKWMLVMDVHVCCNQKPVGKFTFASE